MPAGLSVNNIVNVTVNLTPLAAGRRNFGALLVLGGTDAIDVGERIRSYSSMEGVALDFSGTDPEFLAAQMFFSQSPRPALLYIGRWAKAATAALLKGAPLSPTEQLLSTWTAITSGSLSVTVDGTARNLTGINLSGATSLSQVASLITAAGSLGGTVSWDAVRGRFLLKSSTTGTSSAVAFAATPGAGTNLGPLLKFTAAAGGAIVPRQAVETPLAAMQALVNAEADWYGAMIADVSLTDSQHLQVAAYVEALDYARIYGVTTQATTALDATQTSDLPSALKAAGYSRTVIQYSSSSPYAVASLFGRAFTVDFSANRTAITLKFKQQPGVVAETITKAQADALAGKNCNVFVNYQNGTAIIQEGVMSSGIFFDERHGLDWLANAVQTEAYNLLYTSGTKIPQTDAGITQIANAVASACEGGVTNGLIAPGVWNADGFGALRRGDTLPSGYYVYAPAIASQSQSEREARRSPPIQVAVKLAGAVHFANVAINVNR